MIHHRGQYGLRLVLVAISILGAGAAAGASSVLSAELAGQLTAVCAPPLVCGLAALPLLAIWSPVEPSLIKLGLLSALLSPVWLALVGLFGATALGPERGLVAAYALTAACAPLAWRERVGLERPGRAVLLTCAAAVGTAVFVALRLRQLGAGVHLEHPGVAWHVGVVQAFARGRLENPWLAGTALPTHPGYAALCYLFSSALSINPSSALAALNVWSLALVPLALYLTAAPLWREGRRVMASAWLGLLGWNALGPLLRLFLPAPLVSGEGVSSGPQAALAPDLAAFDWSEWLARATPGLGRSETTFGLSGWLAPSPWVPALAFATGAWMCAAHALRHGKRPWVGLCALLHFAAALVEPVLGTTAFVATALAALFTPFFAVEPNGVRPKVLLALAFAALPVLALVRLFSPSAEPSRPLTDWPGPMAVLLPASLLLAMAAGLLLAARVPSSLGSGGPHESDPRANQAAGDRTILLLLVFASLAPISAPLFGLDPYLRTAELARAASLPLGVLAAGGLFQLIDRGRVARALGYLLGAAAVGGALLGLRHVDTGVGALIASHRIESFGEGDARSREGPRATDRARDLVEAYAWVRSELAQRYPDAALVCEVASRTGRLDSELAPHPAALLAGLPMWCDVYEETGAESSRWAPRNEQVAQLFNERKGWIGRRAIEWRRFGRPLVFIVEEADRRRTFKGRYDEPLRGVETRLAGVGARLQLRFGEVAVYLLEPAGVAPKSPD